MAIPADPSGIDAVKSFKTRYAYGHTGPIKCCAWNSTGSRVATCSADRTLRVWNPDRLPASTSNPDTGSAAGSAVGGGPVDPRSGSSRGKPAAGAAQSSAATGAGGQYVWELRGHTASVEKLSWDPTHSDRLVSVSLDRTLRLWDYRTGRQLWSIDLASPLINCAYSPCGGYVVVGTRDDVISVIDLVARTVVSRFKEEKTNINEMAYNNAGSVLALSTQRGTFKLLIRDPLPEYPVKAAAVLHNTTAPAGPAAATDAANKAKADTNGGTAAGTGPPPSTDVIAWRPWLEIESNTSAAYCVAFDPLGRYLAVGGADAICTLFDIGRLLTPAATLTGCARGVRSVGFSHDGAFLAMASEDPTVEVVCVEQHTWRTHCAWRRQKAKLERLRVRQQQLLQSTSASNLKRDADGNAKESGASTAATGAASIAAATAGMTIAEAIAEAELLAAEAEIELALSFDADEALVSEDAVDADWPRVAAIPTGLGLQAVNAVAWHPNKLALAFVGDDKVLRICM